MKEYFYQFCPLFDFLLAKSRRWDYLSGNFLDIVPCQFSRRMKVPQLRQIKVNKLTGLDQRGPNSSKSGPETTQH